MVTIAGATIGAAPTDATGETTTATTDEAEEAAIVTSGETAIATGSTDDEAATTTDDETIGATGDATTETSTGGARTARKTTGVTARGIANPRLHPHPNPPPQRPQHRPAKP